MKISSALAIAALAAGTTHAFTCPRPLMACHSLLPLNAVSKELKGAKDMWRG